MLGMFRPFTVILHDEIARFYGGAGSTFNGTSAWSPSMEGDSDKDELQQLSSSADSDPAGVISSAVLPSTTPPDRVPSAGRHGVLVLSPGKKESSPKRDHHHHKTPLNKSPCKSTNKGLHNQQTDGQQVTKKKRSSSGGDCDGEGTEEEDEGETNCDRMGNLTERRPHLPPHHPHLHLSPWRPHTLSSPVIAVRPRDQGPSRSPPGSPERMASSVSATDSTSPRFLSDDEAGESTSYIGPHGKKQRTRLIGSESSSKDDEVVPPASSPRRQIQSSPKSTNLPAQPCQSEQQQHQICDGDSKSPPPPPVSSLSSEHRRLPATTATATTATEYFFGIQDPLRKRRSLPVSGQQQQQQQQHYRYQHSVSTPRYHRLSLGSSVVITASVESPHPLNLSRRDLRSPCDKVQQDDHLFDGEKSDDDDPSHEQKRHRRPTPPLNLSSSLHESKSGSLIASRSSVIVPNMPSFGDYFSSCSVSQPLVAQQPPSHYQPTSTCAVAASTHFSNPISSPAPFFSRQGIRKPGRPRKYVAGELAALSAPSGGLAQSYKTLLFDHPQGLQQQRSMDGSSDLPSFGSSVEDPLDHEDGDTPDSTATSSSGGSSTKTTKSETSSVSGIPDAKKKKKSKDYYCEKCDRWFSQLRNYRYHMSRHEGTFIFACTCPECGKRFNDKGYLSSHMKIHRNLKEYVCEYCGKSFNQRVAYNMHTRIHTGLKPHQCKVCPKAFSRKMLLRQHERTHTGERPFHCSVCDKSFADRSNMLLHERLHTGERPYKCSQCGKAFSKNHHLKTHMNHHLGIRPYQCPQCHATFTQSSNMKTHMKKCTGTLHLTGGSATSSTAPSPTSSATSPPDRKLLLAEDTKSFSGGGTTSGGIIMEPGRGLKKFEEHDIVYQVNPVAGLSSAQLEQLAAATTTTSLLRGNTSGPFYTSSPRSEVKPAGLDFSPVKRGRPRKTQPSATITSLDELHQQSGFEAFQRPDQHQQHQSADQYLKTEPTNYFSIPTKPSLKTSPPLSSPMSTYEGKMGNVFPISEVPQIVYDYPLSSSASSAAQSQLFSTTSTERNFSDFDFGRLQQTFQPTSSAVGGVGGGVIDHRAGTARQQQTLSSGYQQQLHSVQQQLRGASDQQQPYSPAFTSLCPPSTVVAATATGSQRFALAPPTDFPEIRNVAQFFEEQRMRPPPPPPRATVQLSPRIPLAADTRSQLQLQELGGFGASPGMATELHQRTSPREGQPQGYQGQEDPFFPGDTFK